MTGVVRFSYLFILLVIIVTGWTHLATPLLTVLFSYFALCRLNFWERKWLAVLLFLVVVSGLLYGLGSLVWRAYFALPEIASVAIPPMIAYAKNHGVELPFTDLDSLKATVMDMVKDEFQFVSNFARAATK